MSGRTRRLFLAGLYAWMPVVYVLVYVPFVVPRLPAWQSIPALVVAAGAAPYLLLVIGVGATSSHRQIVVHAAGGAAAMEAWEAAAAALRAPGMGESWSVVDPVVFWLALLPVKAFLLFALMEIGRAASLPGTVRRRVSPER